MIIKLKVCGNLLAVRNKPYLTSGNIGSIHCEFDFDNLWDNLIKTVVFYQSKKDVKHVLLDGASCVVPYEVMSNKGRVYIGVFGSVIENGELKKRLTSNFVEMWLDEGAYREGTAPEPPTADGYEQIIEIMEKQAVDASRAEAAQQDAETAQGKAETAQGLAEGAKVDAITAQGLAEDAQGFAEAAAVLAESHSKGGTASREGEDTDNALYYKGLAESAKTAAETAQGKAEDAQEGAEIARDTTEGYMTAAQLAAEQAAETAATETVEAASLLLSGYVTDAQTAKADAETAQGKAEEAQVAAEDAQEGAEAARDIAEREADRAEREADDAEGSKDSAATSETVATQAMIDLLAMLGSDIATLTDGKLTPSQIPALSINDVFEVTSVEEMVQLTAERGDVALILLEDNIHDSYILAADDPTQAINWKKLGISYVANAGHASTADNAVNADKINNKRLVSMTESQYDSAVLDPDTIYIVTPDEV